VGKHGLVVHLHCAVRPTQAPLLGGNTGTDGTDPTLSRGLGWVAHLRRAVRPTQTPLSACVSSNKWGGRVAHLYALCKGGCGSV